MKKVQRYNTLADLRSDKAKVRKRLDNGVKKLHNDIVESFVPDNSLIDSALPYMKYVGYAMTAFKTAKTVKGIITFMRRRNWI